MPPDELKSKDFVTTTYYRAVKKEQISLSEAEEIKLLADIDKKRCELREFVLGQPETAIYVTDKFKHLEETNKSTAKLSKNMNNKKVGQNKKIQNEMKSYLPGLITALEHKEYRVVSDILVSLDLSDDFVLYEVPANLNLPESRNKVIKKLQKEINELESILIRSVLKTAYLVGMKYGSTLLGIDVKDTIQEANLGILEAVRLYSKDFESSDGTRVKFVTYAYSKAEHTVKDWIMNNSRTIRIPKSQLEKILNIVEASKVLNNQRFDIDDLVSVTNKIRKSKSKSKLTQEEIENAMCLMETSTIHIDQEVAGGKTWERNRTIGDAIPDEKQRPAKNVEINRINDAVHSAVASDVLTEEERMVIRLRYLEEEPERGLNTYEGVGKRIAAITGETISREWVRKIEISALEKLKNNFGHMKDVLNIGGLDDEDF